MGGMKIRPGDLMFSNVSTNVWDTPGDHSPSSVVDLLEEKQPVIVLEIYKRKYYEHNLTEIKVLTPNGAVGWVAIEKVDKDWVIM